MPGWYTQEGGAGQSEGAIPRAAHALLALWVAAMLALSALAPVRYGSLLQEDGPVEWLGVFLFLAAALVFGLAALRGRRPGDAGVAAFCLVAAGEEISWGQRVLGYLPAETFLERNAQQEANLHNLVEAFGQPKWTLVAVLAAYGLLLPVLARTSVGARLLERLRVRVVPWPLAAWFAAAIMLLVWYPARFTGEWVEAMVGALFLLAARPAPRNLALAAGASALLAAGAERASAHAVARPSVVACARAEAAAILDDLLRDQSSRLLADDDRVHRRLFSLWRDGELDAASASGLRAAPCDDDPRQRERRRSYGIDPWGNAYWVRVQAAAAEGRRIAAYSFGPNRRRDLSEDGRSRGDDIVAELLLR